MNPGAIGVFDSGVGGLTVFKELERRFPDELLIYLGDTARVPYGIRSPETVTRYSLEAARFLRDQQIKLLVVACNSASSVALKALEGQNRIPIVGVIQPGAKRAVEITSTGKIGVIGTRATIGSSAYPRAIHELLPDADVVSLACPMFVPLAEEGWVEDTIAHQVAERYLAPLKEAGVDTLVLGCTHYPLLRGVISRVMGPEVKLVDSAESVATEVRDCLQGEPALAAKEGTRHDAHRFFVTDAPDSFQGVAERFLGRPIKQLEQTLLDGA
jgi:glutamate racemase